MVDVLCADIIFCAKMVLQNMTLSSHLSMKNIRNSTLAGWSMNYTHATGMENTHIATTRVILTDDICRAYNMSIITQSKSLVLSWNIKWLRKGNICVWLSLSIGNLHLPQPMIMSVTTTYTWGRLPFGERSVGFGSVKVDDWKAW